MSKTDARVQATLNDLAAMARSGGFSGYENDPSGGRDAGHYEAFLVRSGMDSYTAQQVGLAASKSPAIAATIKQAMNAQGQGLGMPLPNANADNVIGAATFEITVTRLSANIAEDLPFVLFGSQDACNGYRNIIPQLLGAGTVLTSVLIGEPGGAANANRALFTYTNGANVDTIAVESSTYPYPSLLNSTNVDLLKLNKVRESLSNAALTRQFSLPLIATVNSPFGKGETNRITPSMFVRPDQFQAGIVDLDAVFRIDKETCIVGKIINTAAFVVTFSSFVEKFFRQNTKNLGF